MRKVIKHNNMLRPNPGLKDDTCHYLRFPCRGCTMRNREEIWEGFISSISGEINRKIDNSYLSLEEEPDNRHDENAVRVVCRGEFFGTVGYVGKEYATLVKEILKTCECYRVDMVDETKVGEKEIELVLTWK